MRIKTLVLSLSFLAGITLSRANITSLQLADDNDGVVVCNSSGLQQIGTASFSACIEGKQKVWGVGDVLGPIITDGTDPKLTLANAIENDTGIAWTDYHVTVSLNKSFTLSDISVSTPGWSVDSSTTPTQIGGDWIGTINYITSTAPVPDGGELDFTFAITFAGTVDFHETLQPSNVTVPEPGSLGLLAAGLAALSLWRRRA